MEHSTFNGLRVASFESRLAKAMATLIRRHGGEPHVAPSLREIPLEHNTAVFEFGKQLIANQIDLLILLTGVGTRAMVQVLQKQYSPDAIKAALGRVTLVARGPKPVAALKELDLFPTITVPEPNTWREILQTLDQHQPLTGLRVAVQEYGTSNPDFLDALGHRGANVIRVPVYRWALPEDTAPLRRVLDAILAGDIQIVLITNAAQADHIMQLISEAGQEEQFRQVLQGVMVASIGPTASERVRSFGLPVDLEPSHPKMGILVKEASEQADVILRKKRGLRKTERDS